MRVLFIALIFAGLLNGCSENRVTGRRQLSLVPEKELQSMASTEYRNFLSQSKVVSAAASPEGQMVVRVGNNIANAIRTYYANQGKESVLNGFNWEFNLVDSNVVNAWCMPGGKVVIYSGILPVTQNENGLAIVMGHEITHALAKHGNERLSQGLVQQFGGMALQAALSSKPAETRNLFMQAYGIGTTVGVMLPFSRSQESEADRLGLIYAAMAGYNPEEAVPFWQRMSQLGGSKPPEFLSSHPADETRIKNLRKHMPEALRHYNASRK